jgi:hypothetical protein
MVAQHQIEPAVTVEIRHANAARIANLVGPRCPGNVLELPITKVLEQAVALIAVPRIVADELVAEEVPGLVAIQVCDRTPKEA